MLRRAMAAAVVAPVALWALSASAATRFAVNPAQSTVHFSLADTLHSFGGLFRIASGNIAFDRGSSAMSGRIVVDADSGNSGDGTRDRRMKKDELKVKQYPDIVFEPSRYTGQIPASGHSTIEVSGTFTLLGRAHALTVPMAVTVQGNQCTASGTFEVPYVQWGLKDPSMLMIRMQKQVKIELKLVGELSASE